MKTYLELIKMDSFIERFEYLKLSGSLGAETFGADRYLNQMFYRSSEWKRLRNEIIVRDHGCDLGVPGCEINNQTIIIHHMNPITIEDIINNPTIALDPDYLITTSHKTHNAIHYGNFMEIKDGYSFCERSPFDTCPWKGGAL